MRRRTVLLTAAGLVAVAAAGSAIVVVRTRQTPPPAPPRPEISTAAVVRTTLVETEDVDGTLGHGPPGSLVNRVPGTLTGTAAAGGTVSRGQVLYRVDDQPVVLLYGPLPAYRPLQPGAVGPDVRQFEQNLADLGYRGHTVDDHYTDVTAGVVRDWQDDLGLPGTGVVDLGRVVYCPGPIRVRDFTVDAGQLAPRDGPVLEYTGTTRVVVADLEVTQRQLARVGAAVEVTLPDRSRVAGTVTGIGTVATAPPEEGAGAGGQGSGEQETPTVPVTVAVADQAALGDLDAAPVTVALTSRRREGVLAVPVAALLALREGGYGVQLVGGSGTRVVAVEPGLFAGGLVEVSGDGLTEGAKVGVAAS